ncbi:MAG TPA: A24 family peptidase [Candidatus Sulfomarinibacteraceae bacterium]|nr:A24 family peptidase [Candidatus Sulfomarinibacteraceae bacterium]
MEPIVIAGGIAGLAWGAVADRIAARWPAHEDGGVRAVDWRTAAVALAGGLSGGLLADRFAADVAADPAALAFVAPIVVALVLLFATDLDQRLLPDVVTFPLAGWAVVGFVAGAGPFVRTPDELLWAAVAGIGLPAALYLVSIPFGAGAIGVGDLKLLFGVALLAGAPRVLATVAGGAIAGAVVIAILIAARRITLRSYVPYGPFLIAGALWAMLGSRIA